MWIRSTGTTTWLGPVRRVTTRTRTGVGASSWYHCFVSTAAVRDNRFLYSDRATGQSHTLTQVGTLNPPLTIPEGGRQNGAMSFLFTDHPTSPQRHGIYVFDFSAQQLWTYTVDNYGIAAGETFSWIAGSEWHGIRHNLELLVPGDPYWIQNGVPQNNLQSFLVVQGVTPEGAQLNAGEAKGGLVSQSSAIFTGSAVEKRLKTFRLDFVKKYRSKR